MSELPDARLGPVRFVYDEESMYLAVEVEGDIVGTAELAVDEWDAFKGALEELPVEYVPVEPGMVVPTLTITEARAICLAAIFGGAPPRPDGATPSGLSEARRKVSAARHEAEKDLAKAPKAEVKSAD